MISSANSQMGVVSETRNDRGRPDQRYSVGNMFNLSESCLIHDLMR